MKPLIKLYQVWMRGGKRYELWACGCDRKNGMGNTPLAAFMAWSAKP